MEKADVVLWLKDQVIRKRRKKYIFGSGKLQDQTLLDLDQELFVRSF